MKEGWNISPLKDICEQMNGIWKGVKEPFVKAKILRTTNFSKDCQMKLDDLAVIDVEKKKMDARRLQRGDIIVEKSGGGPKQPVGRVILFNIDDSDFSFCNFTSALRIKDRNKVLPEYLHKYLSYLYFDGETEKYQSNLVGFRNLDFKGYVSMEIHYPSLSEQQRIVDFLDKEFEKIDRLKSNAELNLRHTKDLFQAALKSTFKNHAYWKWNKIGNVCKTGAGGTPSKLHKEYYEGGTIPWLRSGEVCEKYIHSSEMYISESGYQNSSAKWFPENTVLVAMYGATAAQVGILKIKSTTNQAVCGIFPNDNFIPEFLYYSLLSSQKELVSKATGNAQPNISQVKIKETKIPIISLEEQQDVVSQIDSLDTKCQVLQDNYTKTIQLCDDLKQSLLRKAFNGEL